MELTVERALSESRRLSHRGKLSGAESVLQNALKRYPRNKRLHGALRKLGDGVPGDAAPEQLVAQGDAWWREGCNRRARACFEAVLAQVPGSVAAQMGLAMVERSQGDTDAAIARYGAVIAAHPTFAEPYRYISDMRTTQQGDGWIDTLTNALRIARADDARISLGFALGKALTDIGAADAAFTAYEVANMLRRHQLGAVPRQRIAELAQIVQAFAQPRPAPAPARNLTDWGEAPVPIFIVGMPRSGTTLVERILSQHSQVAAGGERKALTEAITQSGCALGWPDARQADKIRRAYRAQMPATPEGTRWITEKLPSNARWIGYVRAALPEARIIETTRDPVAIGWSLYRHHFAASEQMAYTYELPEIAAYLHLHRDMMAQWHKIDPDAVSKVDYEALTEAPADEIPKLLKLLDLPFERACLHPERNASSVHTASFEQVRRPIYAGSSTEWHAFRPYLRPLLEMAAAQ